jgi:hypothetical protein
LQAIIAQKHLENNRNIDFIDMKWYNDKIMSTQDGPSEELWQNIDYTTGYEELRGLEAAPADDPALQDVELFTADSTPEEVEEIWNESRGRRLLTRIDEVLITASKVKVRYIFAGALVLGVGAYGYRVIETTHSDETPTVTTPTTTDPCALIPLPGEDTPHHYSRIEACKLEQGL